MDSEGISRREMAKRVIKRFPHPVSVNLVARKLDLGWATARGLLLSLALEGEISSMRTSAGWIFFPKSAGTEDECKG